jgi:hypothetical protein
MEYLTANQRLFQFVHRLWDSITVQQAKHFVPHTEGGLSRSEHFYL